MNDICEYKINNIDELTNDLLISLSNMNKKIILPITMDLSENMVEKLSTLNRHRNVMIEYQIIFNKENLFNVSAIIKNTDYYSYLFDSIKILLNDDVTKRENRLIKSFLQYKKEIDKDLSNKMYLAIIEVVSS